jgi:hypothetical protein
VDSAAWTVRLIAELDAADKKAKELTTVGQCLEHLCIFNELYLPAISSSLEGNPLSVAQEITLGWFSRWFINNYVEPSSSKRARSPRKIVRGAWVEPSVLDRFLRSNHAADELIRRARAYDVNRIRFRNPFVPLLRFTVGTGLEIIARHEHRHLLQAQGVTVIRFSTEMSYD